jgi:uncharacterized protein YdaU (DUF1376 family)
VNYYEHHLGDYMRDAAHLSMVEEGAYRRLIDSYYIREAPIPDDPDQIYKLARATTKTERNAVDYVLRQFFQLAADGWHQRRCDEEIELYKDGEPEREAKRAADRERQRRARERRAQLFAALREHGQVPPWNTSTGDLEAMLSRVTKRNGVTAPVTPVTRDNTATSPHIPDASPKGTPPNPLVTEGGSRRGRRSGHRIALDEAKQAWNRLIAHKDTEPRTPQVDAALRAIGGYQRIRMRTEAEEPRIKREFCDAYLEAHA